MPNLLLEALLGRAKPNPDIQPRFTPPDQAPPNLLDPAIDFVRGLGYFPTEDLPPDAGKAFGAGAMAASGAPLIGAFRKLSPALNEVQDIMATHQLAEGSDPMAIRNALLNRVTPRRVFHRTPINPPSGFELPREFGPNYTPRSDVMNEKFVNQRSMPGMESQRDHDVRALTSTNRKTNWSGTPPTALSVDDLASITTKSAPAGKTSSKPSIIQGVRDRANVSGRSKLSRTDVAEIRALLDAGEDPKFIATKFGVKDNVIKGIKTGDSWPGVKPATRSAK